VCCYPQEPGFIAALAGGVRTALAEARKAGEPKLLLSAHGLPVRIVKAGDPYPRQVEETAKALMAALGEPTLDFAVCYQSRVGPLKWIGPQTDDEIGIAARAGRAIVVAPVAFVCEHSETLVELDIEYRALALSQGAKAFIRVPTVSVASEFIAGLAQLTEEAVKHEEDGLFCNRRICPPECRGCPQSQGSV
jgi:ferrochelatase